MASKFHNPTPRVAQGKGTDVPNTLLSQMESLQSELLALALRAEQEIEASLRANPQPVYDLLNSFGKKAAAQSGAVWFDGVEKEGIALAGLSPVDLLPADKIQCGLALSGREMSFDFTQSRVYLPVVIFENPILVAVFQIPGLSSKNYEHVCSLAAEHICALRNQMKNTGQPQGKKYETAS
ncbi:MAG: hypothetical protein RIR26_1152 [Pseudomonadota bacterium]|jgi:hypothetical protein